MKRILTYGTYDVLHPGHIRLLRRARALGDFLIIGLSTDEFNRKKHKEALLSYDDRKVVLEAVRYVDLVIPEHSWEQKSLDVEEYNIDTFVMGDDWEGEFDFLRSLCEVVYLARTDGVSSSMLKDKLRLNR